ncbi:MFS transporter [Vogesella oryzae]|uniref:MFS transporter n=1 Tax=Vogesella oryzae TaxID=1735285 RepID=UPI001583AF39|nr:MFS transporter [Vogesella oryzae]
MSVSRVPPLAALAAFYFSYFAFQGLFGPFWSLYLEALSFSPLQISVLMSLSTLARIVSPVFWGWMADRSGKRRSIIFWTSLASAACFVLVALQTGFWGMFATLALGFFFWAAALPLAEATTSQLTRSQPGRYSRIRVWGSIGFVCLASIGGYLLEWVSLASLPWLLFGLLSLVVLAGWTVPEAAMEKRSRQQDSMLATVRQPRVLALFSCCFLLAFAMGPYYSFYSLGLKEAGYDKAATGWLWSVGVMAEILVFWQMPRIMARVSLERLMLASLLVSALRFALIASLLAVPALAVLAQLGHAFTFGVHHAASVGLIHRMFSEQQQARGQGLYTVASFGVGGSLGGLLGGALWQHGGVALTFGISTAAALLGAAVCVKWLRPQAVAH